MKYFLKNIEHLTIKNDAFRRVIYTSSNLQIVLMTLQPNEEIGEEIHKYTDQFFHIEQGIADFYINNILHRAKEGDAIVIPKNTKHNVINIGKIPLKLYTIYSPPVHKDKLVDY